ncbi:MAG: hypothetical protein ACKOC6_10210, partial [bacterium]
RIEHPWWKQQSAPLRRQVEQGIEGLRSGDLRKMLRHAHANAKDYSRVERVLTPACSVSLHRALAHAHRTSTSERDTLSPPLRNRTR